MPPTPPGAGHSGQLVGSLGRVGCCGFYPTKNMTTAEGGMLVTNERGLAERARRLAHHGLSHDGWRRYSAGGGWQYDVEEAGYKYNVTDLRAALGLSQLARLDGFVARRRHPASRYDHALAGRGDLIVP